MSALFVASLMLGWFADHYMLARSLEKEAKRSNRLERELSAYQAFEESRIILTYNSRREVVEVKFGRDTEKNAFEYLSIFPTIRAVDLNDCFCADDDCMEQLLALPDLDVVVLPELSFFNVGQMTDRTLEHIASIQSLVELHIDARHFSDDAFLLIGELPDLKLLAVYGRELSRKTLSELRRANPRLEINPKRTRFRYTDGYLSAHEKANRYLDKNAGEPNIIRAGSQGLRRLSIEPLAPN